MDRADDARTRLLALHQPVPRATKAAVAQNKAEEDSRREPSTFSKVMKSFAKHPDVADATKVGEPTLVDPTPMSATQVMQSATRAAIGTGVDSRSASIETVNSGAPGADQPAPRSDTPVPADAAAGNPAAADASAPSAATQPDPNELKPNAGPADPNELKPNVSGDNGQALPPPQQVNEIQSGAASSSAASGTAAATATDPKSTGASASSSTDQADDSDTTASSKRKKKKGIHKILPL
jgi:hypothetical protein